MLMELELSIKIEAQVPPIELGRQGRIASEGRIPQVDAWERLVTGAREMKKLRLRMFESETGPGKKVEDDAVRRLEHGHVDA